MEGKLPAVLILGDHFGYPGNVVHGVTTYYLHTIPALAESGLTVHACFLREPHPAADGLRQRGIEPIFLSANKWNPFVAFRVAALIRRHGCGIVHACGVKATLVARMAARMTGARAIVHVHDLLTPSPPVGALHRLFGRRADVGIAVSQAVREVAVRGYHVDPQQARVIHNGIPAKRVREATAKDRARMRATLGIAEDAGVLAMIARMHPIKGHRAMMAIMARVVAERPDTVLLLAGDGPERAACEAQVDTLGLRGNVQFLGSRNDVPELLAACDLIVAPSQSEGLPTVAIEGAAVGRATVGFDCGGLRDIVTDGVSGRLIPPGDEAAFGQALVDLLGDRGALVRAGKAALANARRFTLEHHVRELIACYRDTAPKSAADTRVHVWQAS
jgi:glycosyltransferase involved in cell wall biosynthesis